MQNRFKFRAWNKLSNEMKDVISLNINYEFPDCSNVILETNDFDNIKTHNNPITCANGLNNVVLMQCTGLKDKNGKLIYEGDILKFQHGNQYRVGSLEIYKCEWLVSNANFVQKAWCGGALITLYDKCEVIGNIYENKELLEC